MVPATFPKLSTSSVLVTEWIEGSKLQSARGPAARRQATILLNAYLVQLLEAGFMHADPHPGNLLLTKDGRICILDYGLMSRIDESQQLTLVSFLAHLANEDWSMVVDDLQVR